VNYRVFQAINGLAGRWPRLDVVMRFAAEQLVLVAFAVAGVIVVHALLRRRLRPVICFGVSLVVAFGLAQGLERLSHEVRPFQSHAVHQLVAHGPGVSMPSDHATAAFALAFGVLLFLDRRAGFALTAVAVLIGVARVWTGLHYPGDILAGAAIGGLAAFSVFVIDLGARDVQRRTAVAHLPHAG
jgi:undecaprenyl-diphosphatase